jgi:hypothetical protein
MARSLFLYPFTFSLHHNNRFRIDYDRLLYFNQLFLRPQLTPYVQHNVSYLNLGSQFFLRHQLVTQREYISFVYILNTFLGVIPYLTEDTACLHYKYQTNNRWSPCKVPVIFSDFPQNLNFLGRFS